MRQTTIILLFVLSLPFRSWGQSAQSDSLFVRSAKNQAIRQYERAMYRHEHVYEGNEYITHDHRIKIHPYYLVDSLQKGTIAYNGVQYHDVPMLYDVVRDEVSIQPPEGGYRVRLHTNKISSFAMGKHRFVQIVGDSALGIPTGFYQLLHDGTIKVFARRVKTVHEDISSGTYKADYLLQDRFYILKDGAFHQVKTKGSVLSLFPDKEKARELRKFIRTNRLKFKNETREEAITRTAQRYEELTH